MRKLSILFILSFISFISCPKTKSVTTPQKEEISINKQESYRTSKSYIPKKEEVPIDEVFWLIVSSLDSDINTWATVRDIYPFIKFNPSQNHKLEHNYYVDGEKNNAAYNYGEECSRYWYEPMYRYMYNGVLVSSEFLEEDFQKDIHIQEDENTYILKHYDKFENKHVTKQLIYEDGNYNYYKISDDKKKLIMSIEFYEHTILVSEYFNNKIDKYKFWLYLRDTGEILFYVNELFLKSYYSQFFYFNEQIDTKRLGDLLFEKYYYSILENIYDDDGYIVCTREKEKDMHTNMERNFSVDRFLSSEEKPSYEERTMHEWICLPCNEDGEVIKTLDEIKSDKKRILNEKELEEIYYIFNRELNFYQKRVIGNAV